MKTEKIKIGSNVQVVYTGGLYTTYKGMFDKHNIPYPKNAGWVGTGHPEQDAVLKVVKFVKHEDGSSIVFIKDKTGRHFLISKTCLKVVKVKRFVPKTKIVTITIEVPMNCDQKRKWHRPTDYFNESVKEAIDVFLKVETSSERAIYKVEVKGM